MTRGPFHMTFISRAIAIAIRLERFRRTRPRIFFLSTFSLAP